NQREVGGIREGQLPGPARAVLQDDDLHARERAEEEERAVRKVGLGDIRQVVGRRGTLSPDEMRARRRRNTPARDRQGRRRPAPAGELPRRREEGFERALDLRLRPERVGQIPRDGKGRHQKPRTCASTCPATTAPAGSSVWTSGPSVAFLSCVRAVMAVAPPAARTVRLTVLMTRNGSVIGRR